MNLGVSDVVEVPVSRLPGEVRLAIDRVEFLCVGKIRAENQTAFRAAHDQQAVFGQDRVPSTIDGLEADVACHEFSLARWLE